MAPACQAAYDRSVESRAIGGYIWVGTALRFLQDAGPGWLAAGEGHVINNADGLFEALDGMKLPVSRRAYSHLVAPIVERLRSQPADYVLSEADASQINGVAKSLRVVLDAEAAGSMAYVALDRRYAVEKLLADIGSVLAPGVMSALSPVARYDLQEAGRCIAFGLPTAAAFHGLRATEDTLRQLYRHFVKIKRMKTLLWKPMVDALRAKQKRPPDVLLDNLDNIRLSFRNPTDHPEKIYDIEEAQDLFGLCIDVLNRMVRVIQAGSSAPRKTPTP